MPACVLSRSFSFRHYGLDCSLQGSSVHGIFQARLLEWLAIILLQGIFLTQGSNLHLLHWQADSLPLSHLGSPSYHVYKVEI